MSTVMIVIIIYSYTYISYVFWQMCLLRGRIIICINNSTTENYVHQFQLLLRTYFAFNFYGRYKQMIRLELFSTEAKKDKLSCNYGLPKRYTRILYFRRSQKINYRTLLQIGQVLYSQYSTVQYSIVVKLEVINLLPFTEALLRISVSDQLHILQLQIAIKVECNLQELLR